MNVIFRRCLLFLLLVSLVPAVACVDEPLTDTSAISDGTPGPDRDAPRRTPGADNSDSCRASLNIVSGQNPTVAVGQSIELTVRYADCFGEPVANINISFDVSGDAIDTRLSARTTPTDATGEATITVDAGFAGTRFFVEASAVGANPVTFQVEVLPTPTGSIEVRMTYSGEQLHDTFDVSLHDGDCESIDPYSDDDTPVATATVTGITHRPTFTGVPVGSTYAVTVQAIVGTEVLGSDCVDPVTVSGGQTTMVDITVRDLPVVFSGVFTLDNDLDLAEALPPSISTTLHIFDEMTDDYDLYGDPATENFGLDPAAFLLDFIYREFCCWEADPGNTFAECREQSETHPTGDLSQLYIEDFQFWNGAQPDIDGACGVLEENNIITNTLGYTSLDVQQQVQDLITSSVPEAGMRILQLGGDLSRAFTEMQIVSELTVLDVAEHKDGNFTHELKTMIVEIHDLDGVLHTTEFELAAAGLTSLTHSGVTSVVDNRLQIPEHSFRLDFGKLLLYVYSSVMLPLLECDADWDGVHEPCTSTTDLFGTWLNCEDVGSWLGQLIGVPADFSVLCDWGLVAAGAYVDSEIQAAVDAETIITLSGECEASSLDQRRQAMTLENGVWDGTLTEHTYTADFTGAFNGIRNEEN